LQFSEEEQKVYEKEQKIKSLIIPDEPKSDSDSIVSVQFVLPTGERIRRRFYDDDTFEILKNFVETRVLSENGSFPIPSNFIFVTDFPREEFRNFNQTLKGAGIRKKALLRVHEL